MANVTEKEFEVLKAISTSDYFENENTDPVWTFSVTEQLSYSGKAVGAIFKSLQEKELIVIEKAIGKDANRHSSSNFDTVALTMAGCEAIGLI